ncbi:MAG: hypothetical protein R3B40_11555 [Polyangiales bacterium]
MTHSSVRHATPVSPTRHRSARHPRRLGFAAGAGALALALLAWASLPLAARAQAQEEVAGRRHLNVSLGLPVMLDSEDAYDPSLGTKLTVRAGYAIDILVIEGHAGFQQFGARDPLGSGRVTAYGPFVGFGARLRFEVNETLVPYLMGGLRLSWWGNELDRTLRFSPTLVSQLGIEIHLRGSRDWMIHAGADFDVHMPGKAFEQRAFGVGPYVGVGLRI